jgi:hypothetical protein
MIGAGRFVIRNANLFGVSLASSFIRNAYPSAYH